MKNSLSGRYPDRKLAGYPDTNTYYSFQLYWKHNLPRTDSEQAMVKVRLQFCTQCGVAYSSYLI